MNHHGASSCIHAYAHAYVHIYIYITFLAWRDRDRDDIRLMKAAHRRCNAPRYQRWRRANLYGPNSQVMRHCSHKCCRSQSMCMHVYFKIEHAHTHIYIYIYFTALSIISAFWLPFVTQRISDDPGDWLPQEQRETNESTRSSGDANQKAWHMHMTCCVCMCASICIVIYIDIYTYIYIYIYIYLNMSCLI